MRVLDKKDIGKTFIIDPDINGKLIKVDKHTLYFELIGDNHYYTISSDGYCRFSIYDIFEEVV